jgi:hypothetical protein
MIDGRSFNIEWFKEEPLDKEIENLVYLINQVDGVETTDSCFGHHKMPCRIWVRIKNVDIANSFVKRFFYLDPIWSLKLTFFEVDDYADELLFVIESAYQDYPTVDLMVENLTKRFEERINNTEITNALNDKFVTDVYTKDEVITMLTELHQEIDEERRNTENLHYDDLENAENYNIGIDNCIDTIQARIDKLKEVEGDA